MLFSVLINTADVNAENAAEEIILEELNRLRIEKDIPPLRIHPLLSSCASSYAAALSERGYLSHTGGSGMRAVDRFRERGGTSLRVGEVLGSSPPEKIGELFDQWLTSPSHRTIILDTRWTHCGIGAEAINPVNERSGEPQRLFVVIQCIEHPFADITIGHAGEKVSVSGSFNPPENGPESRAEITRPVVKNGTAVYEPDIWNGEEGRFTFILEGSDRFYYLYLGYIRESGKITYTDTLTIFNNCRQAQY